MLSRLNQTQKYKENGKCLKKEKKSIIELENPDGRYA
jgi:hypothetical protein